MSDKIAILGWGRAGKDCAAEFMDTHLGLPYAGSTSWAALPLMADLLGQHPQMVWEQRHSNREFWKRSCDDFRRDNPTLLIQRAFATRPEGRVVTGLRDRAEVLAAKERNLFKHIIWIDRAGISQDLTVTFSATDCDSFIRNDGTLRRFHRNLVVWALAAQVEGLKPSPYASELSHDPNP